MFELLMIISSNLSNTKNKNITPLSTIHYILFHSHTMKTNTKWVIPTHSRPWSTSSPIPRPPSWPTLMVCFFWWIATAYLTLVILLSPSSSANNRAVAPSSVLYSGLLRILISLYAYNGECKLLTTVKKRSPCHPLGDFHLSVQTVIIL